MVAVGLLVASGGDGGQYEPAVERIEFRLDWFRLGFCWGQFQLLESYTKEVEKLKEGVIEELVAVGVEVLEKMNLINVLERLGVSYLFTKEIEEQLDQIYTNYEAMNIDYDLCTTAVHFRIFRQHGYNVSCDVFNKFRDNNDAFKESLKSDLNGILSLYEATYMMVNGEDILDHAFAFTKPYLKSVAPSLSPVMSEHVKHALAQSLHRSVPRTEARCYIPVYELDSSRNEQILRLAKVDFNRVQLLHREEIRQLLRWWKNLIPGTPYIRDRMVECFLWGTIVHPEPEHSFARILIGKVVAFLVIIDDTYDAYGTYDELIPFNEAIQRWDSSAIEQVQDFLKPVLNELLSHHDILEKELEKKGAPYALHYSKETFKQLVRAYHKESEWLQKGYEPSFEEFMACRLSCSTGILVAISFVGIAELATPQEFEWMWSKNKMVTAASVIGRLTNDLAGYKVEGQRKHLQSAVECYMKQYNVMEEEAVDEINKMVDKAWLTINEEMLRATDVSKSLLMNIVNHSRANTEFYKSYDRFTEPEGLKDVITSLFVDPIPL